MYGLPQILSEQTSLAGKSKIFLSLSFDNMNNKLFPAETHWICDMQREKFQMRNLYKTIHVATQLQGSFAVATIATRQKLKSYILHL